MTPIPPPAPEPVPPEARARLSSVLQHARRLGFLGPGSIEAQIQRSLDLLPVVTASAAPLAHSSIPSSASGRVRALDLGSGGGLPGLVLSSALPEWEWTLLDGSTKRAEALNLATASLGLSPRVAVVCQRAEEAARGPLRAAYDLVVARGFAAAAPTSECAAPFLRVGGALIVTEPPGGAPERWPANRLMELGLVPSQSITSPVSAQVLRQTCLCPSHYPRRTGIPVKRPLWDATSALGEHSGR